MLPESMPMNERPAVSIREDTKGRIILTGLRQVTINSTDDLLSALNFGSSIRQTDSTAINAKSSRSHAVFSLNLIQKKSTIGSTTTSAREKRFSVPLEAMSGSESWVTVDSKLHFVDLAGSERLKNTGAHGDRAKEGISINAGLASLGKVIAQLSSRAPGSHVSYRDSRLTRLLQDSLGGNAITYMVACVNPAEFHMSETLNTVQYAQRARAIQSKPEIQQMSDETDKQAVIDRLRAEVSFLRDQIRLSERTDRRNHAPQERAERQHEREVQLQNQVLDVQENYNALSQRHAKLISEITKARDQSSEDTPVLKDAIGDSALERLKRSNSFAEAVEQVVLEYEKTIQSLEASLTSTRSSLSTTESTLMEKETKIAYMETMTQQLQARVQKAMDREASNDNYLRDLEAKVDGITNGEEKSAIIIQDLRRELSRVRESEASCEEYISTLEERLAEAEQDHELLQRQIDRLEHVVERQRSIGKLDNLLHDLDRARHTESRAESEAAVNGHVVPESDLIPEESPSPRISNDEDSEGEAKDLTLTPAETDDLSAMPTASASDPIVNGERPSTASKGANHDRQTSGFAQSPAQSKFVADKLETVTQELFDLRVEHESTVTEFGELARKYQIALNTLAELQDAVDEARHAPRQEPLSPASTRRTSFLGDTPVNGSREDGHHSSSRTLSSELSLVGESPITTESSDIEAAIKRPLSEDVARLREKEALIAQEMERLRRLNEEKEESMAELARGYAQLKESHQDTLDYVEELKVEVQRVQMAPPQSPPGPQVLRRKASQTFMTIDRANRSIASLRNIALENFEQDLDVFQTFELNLNTLTTELQLRSERVQALESELGTVRREMDSKMTIISGLTRERTSLKVSTPIDMSVVATMRDQLMESENKIRELHESHAKREEELFSTIEALKASLTSRMDFAMQSQEVESPAPQSGMPGVFPPTPAVETEGEKELAPEGAYLDTQQVAELQREISEWKAKHVEAMEAMKASELQYSSTVKDLEASMRQLQASHEHRLVALRDNVHAESSDDIDSEFEQVKHQEIIDELQKELDQQKEAAATTALRLSELEASHATLLRQVDGDAGSSKLARKSLEDYKHLVADLEGQIASHKDSIESYKQSLDMLKRSHEEEVRTLANAASVAETEHRDRLASQMTAHEKAMTALKSQLSKAHAEHEEAAAALEGQVKKARNELSRLVKGVSASLKRDIADSSSLDSTIRSLADEREDLLHKYEHAMAEANDVREQLESVTARAAGLQGKVEELTSINAETMQELERISDKEQKSSRLVEELEEQLNSNFDQQQAANNRLSALQTERQTHLQEALQARTELERELEETRAKFMQLEVSICSCPSIHMLCSNVGLQTQLHDARRLSHRESLDPREAANINRADSTSPLRKSASHTSLPSPPPAIPLPPLPAGPQSPNTSSALNGGTTSPPTSRHQSKDIASAQLVEDQEARIRTIEKHLYAEKQLTATLEEALTDLESSSTKVRSEMEGWKSKCTGLEEQLEVLKKERNTSRYSLQAVEEERNARMQAEAARAHLEQRMIALNQAQKNTKKKKNALNCF